MARVQVEGERVRVETEIKKWGNSLALRVTGSMAEVPRFEHGTRVSVDVSSEGFVVRRAVGSLRAYRFPYTESELLEGIDPKTAHAELLATPLDSEIGE